MTTPELITAVDCSATPEEQAETLAKAADPAFWDRFRIPPEVDEVWAEHERGRIAAQLGLPWSEDDGYEGTVTENEVLRRAFAKKKCLPGKVNK